MKKLLLSLMSFGLFACANAQVIYQEDFETTTGTSIPSGYTQTTLATDGGWKSGTGSGLSSQYFGIPEHTRILATNDDGCNCNKSADIIKLPSINLSSYTSNVYIQFDMVFPGSTYNGATETAELQYSTNGGTTWTTLNTIAGTLSTSWTTRAYLLTPVMGQSNVMLAFKYNDGGDWLFGMALDNIKVLIPPAKDGAVTNAYPNARYVAPTNHVLSARIQSMGMDPMTSITLNYQVGSLTPVSKTFTLSPALNFTENRTLNFDPANLTAGTHQNMKVWVSNVNGTGADAVPLNDTATYTGKVYVATQTTLRNVLIEEFTSSTCAPCASLNVTFDPLLQNNAPNTASRFNVVKYQMNWPSPGNDPSYNADGNTRRGFYGVSGIPEVVMNGTSSMPSKTQGAIDSAKNLPAFSMMTANITKSGNAYTGSVNFTPYVTVTGSDLVLYQCYNQEFYNFPGATTSQKDYHHAMRKMMPNGNGKYIATTTSGTAINETSNYTFNTSATPAQNSYDLWSANNMKVEYVAFLQDTVTGEILQSASNSVAVGIVELENNQSIGIYPNPVNSFAVVAIKLNEMTDVSLMVLDMQGRTVYSKSAQRINAGQQELTINTSSFAEGMYTVRVITPAGELTDKILVKH